MDYKKSKLYVFYAEVIFKNGEKSLYGIQRNIFNSYLKLSNSKTICIWYSYSDFEYVDWSSITRRTKSAERYKAKSFDDYIYKSLNCHKDILLKSMSKRFSKEIAAVNIRFARANSKKLNFRVPQRNIQRIMGNVKKYNQGYHPCTEYDIDIFYNEPKEVKTS